MSTPTKGVEIGRFEITEVYRSVNPQVDIILVHGLNGDPQKTWTHKNGCFWPNQLLPDSLRGAPARVLVYGYNADVYAYGSSHHVSSDLILHHAQTLVNAVVNERESEGMSNNAIIWVAHSLGGILVKKALNFAYHLSARTADISRTIYVATYGIIFLGTPHTGNTDLAKMGVILTNIAHVVLPRKLLDTDPQLVKTLVANNETLQNINTDFLEIFQRFQIDFVHETHKTDVANSLVFVVDQASASPQLPGVKYFGIEASHSEMCKFESRRAPGYLNVSTELWRWTNACSQLIHSRLIIEKLSHQQQKRIAAYESLGIFDPETDRIGASSSSRKSSAVPRTPDLISNSGLLHNSVVTVTPSERGPLFIRPPGYRPNSLFVGRQKELVGMSEQLNNAKRREEGTSAILLQCIPGGGKSHLARQYVYDHFDEYPGGIFWVRAKSEQQLAAGYWDIARKIALNPSAATSPSPPLDRAEFISVVVDWLNSNRDWLLILDGIHFDHGESLRRYIPDAKHTSLIYTSTERNVGGDHHFMNPQLIRLPSLSEDEAQKLFLLELNANTPTEEEIRISRALVQRMGCLPLVIHAVAQRLKATREPLARFARDFNSGPRLRDLETFKAVVEQLQVARDEEALNLMRIICFFSQHIPVEMIGLGTRGLSIPIRAHEAVTGKSLNNTFKILNRFALIERSEPPDMNSSQSTRSSREVLDDHVDVIKMHSVVQDFFVDSLKADGSLPDWLGRAVSMFCMSFDMACKRIEAKNDAGLVGDYRSYEIHGTRLQKHLTKHIRRFPILENLLDRIESYLETIKSEIVGRTRASSESLMRGEQVDLFMTSIFDRSSSSSEAGPDTPRMHAEPQTIWHGEESCLHTFDYLGVDTRRTGPASHRILPLRSAEDVGYESGREDGRNKYGNPPKLRKWKWPSLMSLRALNIQDQIRGRLSPAMRVSSPPLPHTAKISTEHARGLIHSSVPSRTGTPGSAYDGPRLSQAELSLTEIAKKSPPPSRGEISALGDRAGSLGIGEIPRSG